MRTVFDIQRHKLDEEIRAIEESLAEGGARSYDHYREMCGAIRGLRAARLIIEASAKTYMEDDDE